MSTARGKEGPRSAVACRRSLCPAHNLVRKPAQLTVDGCDALAPRRQGRVRRLRDVCGEAGEAAAARLGLVRPLHHLRHP